MAVKWAVANGNWSAGTTWNDGALPQADDAVYLNNHTVTVDTIIVCKSISNLASDYSNNGGALIFSTGNNSITSDIYFLGSILRNTTTSSNNIINGNIYGYGNNMYQLVSGSNSPSFIINGNVELHNGSILSHRTAANGEAAFIINGTLSLYDNSYLASGVGTTNVTINGAVALYDNSTTSITTCRLSINGELRTNTFLLTISNIVFDYGGIICNTLDKHQGVIFKSMTINNQASFYWRNLKINNIDYPMESVVLNDVEYARYEVATNNLALYSNTLYLYDGSSWSTIPYLGETTTNVTDSTHSVDPDIDIDGVTTTATDGDIVKYGAYYYMWDDANTIWVKTDYYYIGETTTDISGGSTRNKLFIVGESMKGTMIPVNIPQTTLDRLANCVTVDILDAQLNAKL